MRVTALVHNITAGTQQIITISTATGRDFSAEHDVTLTLSGFELIQQVLTVETFGIRLDDDLRGFLYDPGG